jgi:ABC-type antimicrobial peptide transport system permease subunit
MKYIANVASLVLTVNFTAEPFLSDLNGQSLAWTILPCIALKTAASWPPAGNRQKPGGEKGTALPFGIFAGLALLLACTGIYGVLAYLTRQRTAEIGVRMAVGASVRDVMWLVLSQSLRMIVAGMCLSIVAALAAGQFQQHLVAARRASMVDPLKALRQD